MRSTFIKGTSSSSSSSRMLRMLRMICQSLSTSSTTSIMRSTFIRRTSSSSSSSRPAKCRPDPKFKWKRLAKLRPIIHRWYYRQSVGPIRSLNWNLEKTSKVVPARHLASSPPAYHQVLSDHSLSGPISAPPFLHPPLSHNPCLPGLSCSFFLKLIYNEHEKY